MLTPIGLAISRVEGGSSLSLLLRQPTETPVCALVLAPSSKGAGGPRNTQDIDSSKRVDRPRPHLSIFLATIKILPH